MTLTPETIAKLEDTARDDPLEKIPVLGSTILALIVALRERDVAVRELCSTLEPFAKLRKHFYNESGDPRTGNNFGGPWMPKESVRIDDCRRTAEIYTKYHKPEKED